jgi:hypothetical protein
MRFLKAEDGRKDGFGHLDARRQILHRDQWLIQFKRCLRPPLRRLSTARPVVRPWSFPPPLLTHPANPGFGAVTPSQILTGGLRDVLASPASPRGRRSWPKRNRARHGRGNSTLQPLASVIESGPAAIRRINHSVMRADWADPDDLRPTGSCRAGLSTSLESDPTRSPKARYSACLCGLCDGSFAHPPIPNKPFKKHNQ